jgi:hypothetical protein
MMSWSEHEDWSVGAVQMLKCEHTNDVAQLGILPNLLDSQPSSCSPKFSVDIPVFSLQTYLLKSALEC